MGARRRAALRALGGAHVRRVRTAPPPAARQRPRTAAAHRGQLATGTDYLTHSDHQLNDDLC